MSTNLEVWIDVKEKHRSRRKKREIFRHALIVININHEKANILWSHNKGLLAVKREYQI